jgi:hypothetical protein
MRYPAICSSQQNVPAGWTPFAVWTLDSGLRRARAHGLRGERGERPRPAALRGAGGRRWCWCTGAAAMAGWKWKWINTTRYPVINGKCRHIRPRTEPFGTPSSELREPHHDVQLPTQYSVVACIVYIVYWYWVLGSTEAQGHHQAPRGVC